MSPEIADLLFPHIPDFSEVIAKYPPRNFPENAFITRCPPSPTGELHIGTLFNALVNSQIAKQSGGTCILRIEDTDKDREVTGSETRLIENLKLFGISFSEGATLDGEIGEYGPYRQSQRIHIYQSAAKYLVANGYAYPCFLSETEIEEIETTQKSQSVSRTGIYDKYAIYRNSSTDEIKSLLEKGIPFQIRFKSPSKVTAQWTDAVMGQQVLKDQEINDFVLLRRDGSAVYRLANVIDDHLMGVSLILRDNLWLDQTSSQILLWQAFGWTNPQYAHYAPIAKIDPQTGNKRKLSKRKDPEASIEYYKQLGYPTEGILNFITNLANSKFETWQAENPTRSALEYPLDIHNLPSAPPLFDPVKLDHDSKEAIGLWTPEDLYTNSLSWSKIYDPELFTILSNDPQYSKKVFAIERVGENNRKDLSKLSDIRAKYSLFYNGLYTNINHEKMATSNVTNTQTITEVLKSTLETLPKPTESKDEWITRVRNVSKLLGFAENRKQYKENPQLYKGDFSDIMQLTRISLTGSTQSPDLFDIIQVLGTPVCVQRISQAISSLNQ